MLSSYVRHQLFGIFSPLFLFLAIGLGAAGFLIPQRVQYLRMQARSVLEPYYTLMSAPLKKIRNVSDFLYELEHLHGENARLSRQLEGMERMDEENAALKAENVRLKSLLHWGIEDHNPYFSAYVYQEEKGPYLHSALLRIGEGREIGIGALALDAKGLLGRISETRDGIARLLLINDPSSRIPVQLVQSAQGAILRGAPDNSLWLGYYSSSVLPQEGERVETRAQPGLEGGLLVGHVHYSSQGEPLVVPAADLAHLSVVRLLSKPVFSDAAASPRLPYRRGFPVESRPKINSLSFFSTLKTFFLGKGTPPFAEPHEKK